VLFTIIYDKLSFAHILRTFVSCTAVWYLSLHAAFTCAVPFPHACYYVWFGFLRGFVPQRYAGFGASGTLLFVDHSQHTTRTPRCLLTFSHVYAHMGRTAPLAPHLPYPVTLHTTLRCAHSPVFIHRRTLSISRPYSMVTRFIFLHRFCTQVAFGRSCARLLYAHFATHASSCTHAIFCRWNAYLFDSRVYAFLWSPFLTRTHAVYVYAR